jgi:hypothetical protein
MPNNFTDMDTTASVIAFIAGLWGAFLNFVKRDNTSHSLTKKVLTFIIDMTVNVGITMLIYIGCVGYGFNDLLSVAVAGFLGHQGTRSFYIMELILAEKLGAKQTFNQLKDDK